MWKRKLMEKLEDEEGAREKKRKRPLAEEKRLQTLLRSVFKPRIGSILKTWVEGNKGRFSGIVGRLKSAEVFLSLFSFIYSVQAIS